MSGKFVKGKWIKVPLERSFETLIEKDIHNIAYAINYAKTEFMRTLGCDAKSAIVHPTDFMMIQTALMRKPSFSTYKCESHDIKIFGLSLYLSDFLVKPNTIFLSNNDPFFNINIINQKIYSYNPVMNIHSIAMPFSLKIQ